MSSAPIVLTKQLKIRSEHVNCFRKLRTSTLLRFLQEMSIAHTEELGMGRDKTLDKGLLWVITRQNLSITRMPEYDETITLRSYPGEMMHLFFPRYYEILSGNEVIITAQALWMLIDEKTRSFVFPEEYGIFIPGDPKHTEEIDRIPLRFPEQVSGLTESSYKTRFSQVDINGHVNNACYFDMIEDLMPPEKCNITASLSIKAEYGNEIRPGEIVTIRSGYEASSLFFEGIGSKPKFRIKLDD
ncbi:MAG: hypothetical protein K6A92_10405 [Lachnospiraceae bacterium]|nr:hypothetical protein [Lachnospiraceae bacterium]